MTKKYTALLMCLWLVHAGCAQPADTPTSADTAQAPRVYSFQTATRDGIGKIYHGREIAKVMGHTGAAWLERDDRAREERPDLLLKALDLQPQTVVADIGAGTGYFTFRIAPYVPAGRVYAVDVQREMVTYLRDIIAERKIENVEPVLGQVDDPHLPPETVDLVLLVDAYHEFSHPYEMMQGIVRALRPDGRVALVEYRAEDPRVPIKPLHKMSEPQAIREMEAVGLRFAGRNQSLPQQHVLFFRKADDVPATDGF